MGNCRNDAVVGVCRLPAAPGKLNPPLYRQLRNADLVENGGVVYLVELFIFLLLDVWFDVRTLLVGEGSWSARL